MKKCIFLTAVLLGLLVGACVVPGSQKTPLPVTITKDEIFVLSAVAGQDTASGLDLQIRLVEVKDSRCPNGVECVWAGKVTVTLEVSVKGAKAETVELTLGGVDPADQISYQLDTLFISLVSVDPYPEAGREYAKGDVKISLLVSDAPLG